MTKNPFNKEQKTFSVIAPVYKDAWNTFPRFFQALEEQDYKHFEVIIVFDGPNTRGKLELAKMKKEHPNIKVDSLEIEHGGAPKARNAGANMAKGDYLTFLDPDVYPESQTFHQWANQFEENPDKDVVWGLYSFLGADGKKYPIPDAVPKDPKGAPDYWAFRYTNYCSGMFPVRKEAFIGWDESVKSLQDWDMWQRMLLKDNFRGDKFLYIPVSYCYTDPVKEGGISHDSATHWKERRSYIMKKNGIPQSKMCVTSLGAPWHGLHVAKKLGAEYLPMPSFKEHDYEAIYLLGFYPGPGGPTKTHLAVFAEPGHVRDDEKGLPDVQQYFKGKKIIHWIGTDVLKMRTEVPFVTIKYLRDLFKENDFILLSEAEHIQKELQEIGIDTQVIPIPPDTLFEPIPLPEEFAAAIYENPTQDLYNNLLMKQVARACPDIKFYFFGDDSKKDMHTDNTEHLGWIDLKEWMPKFSVNVRVTVHDGLPLTPLQFLTAGRGVVSSTNIVGASVVGADRKEIIERIRYYKEEFNTNGGGVPRAIIDLWTKKLNFETYKSKMEALCN